MVYCIFGSKERPAGRSFCVRTASWATTMLGFQPKFWCHLQLTSLCFMDPEPFHKVLFSTKVFASGAELFASAVLAGPTQDFILFCMELRGKTKTRQKLVEFLSGHAKQQAGRVPSRWYTVLQQKAHNMYLLLHLRWNPTGKRPSEGHDHIGVTRSLRSKTARAGQCTYNCPDVSTHANAVACQLLEDLKVYQFLLWMANFYQRRFRPTPHSSDKSLNPTVFAVCLVPIRLDAFPGYCSLSSIVGRIDATATTFYKAQQEHHTLFVNT